MRTTRFVVPGAMMLLPVCSFGEGGEIIVGGVWSQWGLVLGVGGYCTNPYK